MYLLITFGLQHSRTMSQNSMSLYDTTQTQRDMIAQLEARNREIMREISRLRYEPSQCQPIMLVFKKQNK